MSVIVLYSTEKTATIKLLFNNRYLKPSVILVNVELGVGVPDKSTRPPSPLSSSSDIDSKDGEDRKSALDGSDGDDHKADAHNSAAPSSSEEHAEAVYTPTCTGPLLQHQDTELQRAERRVYDTERALLKAVQLIETLNNKLPTEQRVVQLVYRANTTHITMELLGGQWTASSGLAAGACLDSLPAAFQDMLVKEDPSSSANVDLEDDILRWQFAGLQVAGGSQLVDGRAGHNHPHSQQRLPTYSMSVSSSTEASRTMPSIQQPYEHPHSSVHPFQAQHTASSSSGTPLATYEVLPDTPHSHAVQPHHTPTGSHTGSWQPSSDTQAVDEFDTPTAERQENTACHRAQPFTVGYQLPREAHMASNPGGLAFSQSQPLANSLTISTLAENFLTHPQHSSSPGAMAAPHFSQFSSYNSPSGSIGHLSSQLAPLHSPAYNSLTPNPKRTDAGSSLEYALRPASSDVFDALSLLSDDLSDELATSASIGHKRQQLGSSYSPLHDSEAEVDNRLFGIGTGEDESEDEMGSEQS